MLQRVKESVSNLVFGLAAANAKAWSVYEHNLFHELHKRATIQSADYIEKHLPHAVYLRDYEALFAYAMDNLSRDLIINLGLYIELGVSRGKTINHIAKRINRPVHGFDSFVGLPEDWPGWRAPKGHFSQDGRLPKVRENVRLHKGWFEDTLPTFAEANSGPIALLHVHCDLYTSTKTGLDVFGDRLAPGTIIIFHEYFGYFGWKHQEHRAWKEFVKKRNVKYEYLAYASGAAGQVVIRVLENPGHVKPAVNTLAKD